MTASTTNSSCGIGPGFLTLVDPLTLVGTAFIEVLENGVWNLHPDNLKIRTHANTIALDVGDLTEWRVAYSHLVTDADGSEWAFYNADLSNQPASVEATDGDPHRNVRAGVSGVTTSYETFTGPGSIAITDFGNITGRPHIEIEDSGEWCLYHEEGKLVMFDMSIGVIEIKAVGSFRVVYQVPNRYAADTSVWDFTSIDYTGGFTDPVPVFDGTVADINLTQDVEMTPVDLSLNFTTGGAVSAYSVTSLPIGLNLNKDTGVISGTPTNISSFNPIVTGTNGYGSDDTNVFGIDVLAP